MRFLSNYPTEILILLFLIITYGLSISEKLLDWKGNINFIKNHFKNSPLKNHVAILLAIILILESIATVFMIVGGYEIYSSGSKEHALFGITLSAIVLLCLLIGQRLAKDYQGAMSLGIYFLITLFGIYLLNS